MSGLPSPFSIEPARPYAVRYVVGFLFHKSPPGGGPGDFGGELMVLLLRKTKPAWQDGKLNGPGGKVELGETFEAAMRREFAEEVGPLGATVGWEHFATLKGSERDGTPYEIAYFRADAPPAVERGLIVSQYTAYEYNERPEWVVADRLPSNVLPNVRWLIPMACYPPLSHGWPFTVVEGQPNPGDRASVPDATGQP